jgi:hypothetical protein
VRDQVSHPYKTKGKVTVLCVSIFKCFRGSGSFWTARLSLIITKWRRWRRVRHM